MRFEAGVKRGAGWVAAATIVFSCSSPSDDLFNAGARGGTRNASSGGGGALSGASSPGAGGSDAGRPARGGNSQSGAPASGAGRGGGSVGVSGAVGSGGNKAQGGAPMTRGGTAGAPVTRTGGTAGSNTGSGGASGAAGSGGELGEGGSIGAAGAGGEGGQEECVGEGAGCRRPVSCAELHRESPSLPSGRYTLDPAGAAAEFTAYCEMVAEGGGWTLVLNMGPTFNREGVGVPGVLCYEASCTNASYSSVLLEADLMLDFNATAIVGDAYQARAIITGVDVATRGRTVRALFNSGPNYIERDDNSNVVLRLNGTGSCIEQLQDDLRGVLCPECANNPDCGPAVMVFGDSDSGCDSAASFAIGAATNRTTPWTNCAGWPTHTKLGTFDYYPDFVRVWIR